MHNASMLTVSMLIAEERNRQRLSKHLTALRDSSEMRSDGFFSGVEFHSHSTWEDLVELLKVQSELSAPFTLIVSDQLVRDGEFDHQAKELIDPYYRKPLVTLAVTETGERISDIDHAVKPTARRAEIAGILGLLTRRLAYMAPPVKREFPNLFQVRLIENEYELHEYYRLRYDVYRVMGYIGKSKERVKSQHEIDGCDFNAVHFGAFEECDGFQRLVGTARLLLTEAKESKWAAWTRNLLRTDRPLRTMVKNETLSLGLPVFQSQQLNDHLQEAFQQELLCAELSRVIVKNEFRGAGIARRLAEASIRYARDYGVKRLYLECLRLHESFYTKFGFSMLSSKGAQVIGINKSMIAMMMMPTMAGAPGAKTLASSH